MRLSTVLALALLLAGATASAAVPAAREPGPTLTLDAASISGSWRESWLTAEVRFSGSVAVPANLTAVLRPLDRIGPPAASARVSVAAPGQFSGKAKLPPRLRPGRYRLTVTGTSSAAGIAPASRDVTLASPREGVADRAVASAARGGPPASTLASPRLELWARFHFLVPPRSGKVQFAWHSPSFRWLGRVTKPAGETVETSIRSQQPLERGVWFCVATSGGRVVKRVRVRVG